jgi:hypothetical protein
MSKMTVEKKIDDGKAEKVKLPKSVPYIIVNVFFERFSTGGITGEHV